MDTGANHRPMFFVFNTGHRPDMNHMFGPQYTRLYHDHAFGSQYTRVYTLIRDPASHTDLSDDDAGIVAVTLGLIAGVGLILVARSLATLAVTTAVVALPMALGGVSIVSIPFSRETLALDVKQLHAFYILMIIFSYLSTLSPICSSDILIESPFSRETLAVEGKQVQVQQCRITPSAVVTCSSHCLWRHPLQNPPHVHLVGFFATNLP